MLIPSIDLQGGRIVQLVQGERLAVESADIDAWVRRFSGFSKVQLIDLDAAKGEGENRELVSQICARLPCRVGGGIRTLECAREVLARGATHVIIGSALFRDGRVDDEFARTLSDALGRDRVIAAVDSRAGAVVTHGWRTRLALSAVDAVRALEPYVGEFLYTHVDSEGLMQGTDISAIRAIRSATTRAVTAAGGITTAAEVDELQAMGVDAVVGMAIYTGRFKVPEDLE
ncbi:MAG: 1-(5-phosphoribosyl)-5-[(5-phosphoribosylamino)methylideneamino] imidazole-4-carboxamide isomerase [Acidobacteria bacterium]|nr:1-(5-phosphoribosyl)-5-[(5-phosphoribosylamino)methylideneamino] imidazole-4-carboxamide isomerase [Acidobacteriota bacterium]MCA1648761.1 1-(5-phosphoribosyl)-5-[(5-phosphoribosylamino)methylideneamino] imidazole-4-carboxamide isomerase [Acidobacteriota bacterium]